MSALERSSATLEGLGERGPGAGLGVRVIYSLQRRDHHKPQHGREEYRRVQEQAQGCRRAHGICDLEESAEDGLGQLVGLRIRHDKEHQRRYERILGLQSDVHLFWLRDLLFRTNHLGNWQLHTSPWRNCNKAPHCARC